MSEYIDTIIARVKKYSDKDFEKKVPGLTYLGGDQVGRRIMLADDRITLGRSPEATIMLRDNHVSRLHIAIAFDPDRNGYRVQDLGSSNGTLLNGARISEAILKESDKILIGETMLRFGWSDVFDLQYQTEIDNLVNIDEFMAVKPNVQAEEAHQIAEKLRMRVETHPYEKDGISLRPTICIGVSNLKADDSMTSLFKRSDDALYMSKRTGRNKVSVSE